MSFSKKTSGLKWHYFRDEAEEKSSTSSIKYAGNLEIDVENEQKFAEIRKNGEKVGKNRRKQLILEHFPAGYLRKQCYVDILDIYSTSTMTESKSCCVMENESEYRIWNFESEFPTNVLDSVNVLDSGAKKCMIISTIVLAFIASKIL